MAEERAFGWIPDRPDFRDRQYAPPAYLMAQALPRKTSNREVLRGRSPWSPAWDQRRIGSCGPHTSARDIVFAALAQQKQLSVMMPSRNFIYYISRREMGPQYVNQDSGVSNREMLKALNKYGWCDEALHPYTDGPAFVTRPSDAAFAQAATRKIVEYLAVPQQLETMKACLAAGDPFIFGFSVYSNMMTPQVEATGDIPMPAGNQQGGHDVLVVDYDDDLQRFILFNSWGEWGKAGEGSIPYAYATNPRMASDFWTVRHSGINPAPVPPGPGPTPPTPTPVRKRLVVSGTDLAVEELPV